MQSLRPLHPAFKLGALFDELSLPEVMIPDHPHLLAIAHDGLDGFDDIGVKAFRVPLVAATLLVQLLVAIVMRDLAVVALVSPEDESVGPDLTHQCEHGQECRFVVPWKMQVMPNNPALYFVLCHMVTNLGRRAAGMMERMKIDYPLQRRGRDVQDWTALGTGNRYHSPHEEPSRRKAAKYPLSDVRCRSGGNMRTQLRPTAH